MINVPINNSNKMQKIIALLEKLKKKKSITLICFFKMLCAKRIALDLTDQLSHPPHQI